MLQTALDAGVSPETLRKIETGRVATPAFSTVAAIANVLGLSLDAVWADIEPPQSGAGLAGSDRAVGSDRTPGSGRAVGSGRAARERLAC